CPYCGVLLVKFPARKTKCESCGQFIYVRTSPEDEVTKILVTENELAGIESRWEMVMYRKRWLRTLREYGVSKSDFISMKKELSVKFGQVASDRDVIWSLLVSLVSKPELHSTLHSIYYTQGLFLDEEGRDSFHIRQHSIKAEPNKFKSTNVVRQVE